MHVLRADGRIGLITAWKLIPGAETMYNLEVAQDHTFTVGTGEWIVHNCTPIGDGPNDQKIIKDFLGTDEGDATEGEAALLARNQGFDVLRYNKKFVGTGKKLIGEIDVETPDM